MELASVVLPVLLFFCLSKKKGKRSKKRVPENLGKKGERRSGSLEDKRETKAAGVSSRTVSCDAVWADFSSLRFVMSFFFFLCRVSGSRCHVLCLRTAQQRNGVLSCGAVAMPVRKPICTKLLGSL